MAGTALSQYNDFNTNTTSAFLTSAEDLINEVQKKTYVLTRFIFGKDFDQIVQGGKDISDTLLTTDPGTYQDYTPGDSFQFNNAQVSTIVSIPWRFSFGYKVHTSQEILLQANAQMGDRARFMVFKKVRKMKEQAMWTSILNGMEASLWRLPANNEAQMEQADGKRQNSIPVFINEQDATSAAANKPGDGLFTDTASGAAEWTTIMGRNPTNFDHWRCQRAQYDFADPGDNDSSNDGIFDAFDSLYWDLRWQLPGKRNEFFDATSLARKFVATSKTGVTLYTKFIREGNDSFYAARDKQDPAYVNPAYAGMDIIRIHQLDDAALYPGDNNGYTSHDGGTVTGGATGVTNTGPRYYCLDGEFITPIFHSERFFAEGPVKDHPFQKDTFVQSVDIWWNLFCNSRQRHGIIYPGA